MDLEEATTKQQDNHKSWIRQLDEAEELFKKKLYPLAEKAIRAYQKDKDENWTRSKTEVGIFAANIDILLSSLFAQIPTMEVERKFKDANDDVARVEAIILQRCIQSNLENPDYAFKEALEHIIFDRLVPGFGQAWVNISTDQSGYLKVSIDHLNWEDFIWSPCRTWSERTWVARKVYFTRKELEKRFPKHGSLVPLTYDPNKTPDKQERYGQQQDNKAVIYEIWNRTTKQVLWVCRDYPQILEVKDDPFNLPDFEPCPTPLFSQLTTQKVLPKPDYYKAKDQYEKLNELSTRIDRLVSACKLKGCYDAKQPALKRLMTEAGEEQLIPVDNWDVFAEKGGVKGIVSFMPIGEIAAVIVQLEDQKVKKKQEIYELTGLSDIIRGSTSPRETAAAQQIKAQFASGRIQALQKKVENFVTECVYIKAQLEAAFQAPQYFLECSNIMLTEDAQLAVQAVLAIKQRKSLEYAITIKPDSMAQIDYTREKQDRMEMLGTVGTYLEKALPLMQISPMAANLVLTMLKFALAGYKAGKEFEGVIDKFINITLQAQQQAQQQPQQPRPPTPEQVKMQELQVSSQQDQQRLQLDSQIAQQEFMNKQQEMALEKQALEIEKLRTLIEMRQPSESAH